MSGILRLESLTKGNTLKQGDKTPLKYRLFDADGEKLNIAGKSAKVRLVYPDFLTIGYEKDGLTVAQDDTVTFTIDNVIPSRIYHVEIIVDEKFIFPSRADESKFTVDKSSLGTESNIVEIVGVDAVVRKAVDLINQDPSLIIDEDKLVTDIISNTGIGNINEYYKAFNDLKPKAEQSITKSAEALSKSQNALNVANGIDAKATNALSLSKSADTLSKSVQEQFNQVVIDGDSSVEAAQARIDASGQTNPTLKARLDKEHNEVTTQLAQIPTLAEMNNPTTGVKYIAHRGLSDVAPENSLPAYVAASKAGFWGAEADVQRTSDGEWILMHDSNVDRTTNGTGNVIDMTLAQIKNLVIDTGNNVGLYPNLRVPTMEEYLNLCKRYDMVPIIEIKSAFVASDCADFVAKIKKYDFEEKCIVICFDLLILWEIRKYSKKIVLQYLASISDTSIMHVKNMGNAGIDCEASSLTKALIEKAHSENISVNSWTVDSYEQARLLAQYGVDMITTNKISNFKGGW